MATSRVKTNLLLTFEIAAKWQYVCYTQRSYRLISLNQPIIFTITTLCRIWHRTSDQVSIILHFNLVKVLLTFTIKSSLLPGAKLKYVISGLRPVGMRRYVSQHVSASFLPRSMCDVSNPLCAPSASVPAK